MSAAAIPCAPGIRFADRVEDLSRNMWRIVAIEEIVCGERHWHWTVDRALLADAIMAHRRADDGVWTIVARLPKARGGVAAE